MYRLFIATRDGDALVSHLITTEADVIAAQRAMLARQHAELQARIALARAGRSPAQLKAEEDRILAEINDILTAFSVEAA